MNLLGTILGANKRMAKKTGLLMASFAVVLLGAYAAGLFFIWWIGLGKGIWWLWLVGGSLVWTLVVSVVWQQKRVELDYVHLQYDIMNLLEQNRLYQKDMLLLWGLDKEDLSDRNKKERRELIDELLQQFDCGEAYSILSLLLERKSYTNYNPDEQLRSTEENTGETY